MARVVDGRAYAGQPFNPYKIRVYQANTQTIADNTAGAKVAFDTVTFDTDSDFSTTNNNYVARVSGYYFIAAKVGLQSPAIANLYQIAGSYIYVNSASVSEGTIVGVAQGSIGTGRLTGANVFDTVRLNAGDTVDIRVTVTNGGGNWTTRTATSDLTYWSIHLVSV